MIFEEFAVNHQIDPTEGYASWKDYEEAEAIQEVLDNEPPDEVESEVN